MKDFRIRINQIFKNGKFGFRLLALILISSLLTTFAQCPTVIPPEVNKVKPDGSATLEIKGVATVNFPPDSFSPGQELDIAQTSDPDTVAIFDELSEFHRVHRRIDYEVRINTGENYPITDEFEIVLNIPDSFLSSMPQNLEFDLFVQLYQDGGMEILDEFEIFPSDYDPARKELKAKLPYWVFTDTRTPDKTYEAIITLAATNFTANDDTVMVETSSTLEDRKCDSCDNALPIQCPLREIGCKETSRFNIARLHPKTKKIRPHLGVDLSTEKETGKKVYAAANGVVKKVWISNGGGLNIWIQHEDKSDTIYRHLEISHVKEGDKVFSKTIIALSGNSGIYTTGPHLHFEYRPYCKKSRVDPYPCIDFVPPITENSFTINGSKYIFGEDSKSVASISRGTIIIVEDDQYQMQISFQGYTTGIYQYDFSWNDVAINVNMIPTYWLEDGTITVTSYGEVGEIISGFFSGKAWLDNIDKYGTLSGKFSVIREPDWK